MGWLSGYSAVVGENCRDMVRYRRHPAQRQVAAVALVPAFQPGIGGALIIPWTNQDWVMFCMFCVLLIGRPCLLPDIRSVGRIRHRAASGNQCLMRRCRVLSGLHYCRPVGRIRHSCRIRQSMPVRRCRVLSGLQLLPTRRPDKHLCRIRQSMPDATLSRLIRPQLLPTRRPDKALAPHQAVFTAATQNFFLISPHVLQPFATAGVS